MSPEEFEPTISASERPLTHDVYRAGTGTEACKVGLMNWIEWNSLWFETTSSLQSTNVIRSAANNRLSQPVCPCTARLFTTIYDLSQQYVPLSVPHTFSSCVWKFYNHLRKISNPLICLHSTVYFKAISSFTFTHFLFKNTSLYLWVSPRLRSMSIAFSSPFYNGYFPFSHHFNPHNLQIPVLNLQLLPCEKYCFKGSHFVTILFRTECRSVYIIEWKWRGLYTEVRQSPKSLFFHSI